MVSSSHTVQSAVQVSFNTRRSQSSKVLNASRITLTKGDLRISAYNRVLDLLANDPHYQREVALGKRIGFYKLGQDLGAGNFSKVKLGAHILTKERVAIKIIEKSRLDQKAQRLLAREIQNMERTHHPNIIRLFEVVETLTKLHLILEYAGGGELYDHVINNIKMSEDESRPIFAQILAAVVHMHEIGIIHRDIKAENVFFAGPNLVKLGDFGFSVAVKAGDTLNTFCGSPPYAAPELFRDKSYHGACVDIWALGILLYFMVTGNTPFRGDTVSELKKEILTGQYEIPDHVSPLCQQLIHGSLKMEPNSRHTLDDMRKHSWLANAEFPHSYERHNLLPVEDDATGHPSVKEVWETLHKYGISPSMLKEAALRGAKNSVVGTYRIVLYQVQTRLQQQQGLIAGAPKSDVDREKEEAESMQKKPWAKRTSRLCVIL